MALAKAPGAGKLTTAERRRHRLEQFPHWADIEARLCYRHSPWAVVAWHKERFPKDPPPGVHTLYMFLADQGPGWLIDPPAPPEAGIRRLAKILVVEEQQYLIGVQKHRLRKQVEMETGMLGLPIPEVARNVELLDRLLMNHLRAQQELGLEPKVATFAPEEALAPGAMGMGNPRWWLAKLSVATPQGVTEVAVGMAQALPEGQLQHEIQRLGEVSG